MAKMPKGKGDPKSPVTKKKSSKAEKNCPDCGKSMSKCKCGKRY